MKKLASPTISLGNSEACGTSGTRVRWPAGNLWSTHSRAAESSSGRGAEGPISEEFRGQAFSHSTPCGPSGSLPPALNHTAARPCRPALTSCWQALPTASTPSDGPPWHLGEDLTPWSLRAGFSVPTAHQHPWWGLKTIYTYRCLGPTSHLMT